MMLTPEPSFLYSSRSFWYPQAPVSDYATARIRISVPPAIDCVASGELEPGFPAMLAGKDPAQNREDLRLHARRSRCAISRSSSAASRAPRRRRSRFDPARRPTAGERPLTGTIYRSLNLSVEANPRQVQRGRELAERAADIALFYESLIGDSPYSSFTVALVESDLPGGHSPGYFAALNQPLPTSPLVWRNDPAAFSSYPDFFLAHELAHQWWGQAVGWRNYHEQWLSEGFAQYFAALYAQHQTRRRACSPRCCGSCASGASRRVDQGPVYLGYRLGHIRGESRIFRALVYNKGAAVLHMLRRLVGDDAFFRGLRRFYASRASARPAPRSAAPRWRRKPGSRSSASSSAGSTARRCRKLKVGYRVEGTDVVLHVEQIGEVFDVPVTVTLQYADRKPVEVLVAGHRTGGRAARAARRRPPRRRDQQGRRHAGGDRQELRQSLSSRFTS